MVFVIVIIVIKRKGQKACLLSLDRWLFVSVFAINNSQMILKQSINKQTV